MIVAQWTGRRASVLRSALRMSVESFAGRLGVATRTVARWESDPEIVPIPSMQQILDTTLERASADQRTRFTQLLDAVPAMGAPASPTGLYVAIAIVRRGHDVLLVHRRDGDSLTWQFPAGVVKPGAQAGTIAVRETLSETGVHCTVAQEIGSRIHPVTGVYCVYYLCDYLTGEAENRDVIENLTVAWVSVADLPRFVPESAIYPPVLTALRGRHDAAGT